MSDSLLHRNLLAWYAREARDLPWRRTTNPYAIAVSEFMLQQTQVVTVLPYYRRWMERFPTVEHLAAAEEAEVLKLWQGLGYYSRARHLHRLAKMICEDFAGEFPREFAALRRLPGVGEYTAHAILAFAFDLPAPVVDGNIARVLSRWFDYTAPIDSATGKAWLREKATALQPREASSRQWNSAVMELGATICRAGQPDCLLCPVRRQCQTRNPAALPQKAARPSTIHLEETRGLFLRGPVLLLEQSPGPRWKGLWRLPLLEPTPSQAPLATIVYPVTRYRITLRLVPGKWPKVFPERWKSWPLASLPPMPAPDRRILQATGLLAS